MKSRMALLRNQIEERALDAPPLTEPKPTGSVVESEIAPTEAAKRQYSLGVSLVLYKNDPALVRAVLESVHATPCEIHVCVVDNSPTDGLRDTVSAFGVRYVHKPSNPG